MEKSLHSRFCCHRSFSIVGVLFPTKPYKTDDVMFCRTFASSIIAPGRQKIQQDFELSTVTSVLPFSVFKLVNS